MSNSGRHQHTPTDTTHLPVEVSDQIPAVGPAPTPEAEADGACETDTPAGDETGPVQLALATPEAHVRFHLDRHTREIGLAHVAEIKRQLAASAARRADQQAAVRRDRGSSGRAA